MVLIEIYTREGCMACESAKRMLREKGVSFNEYKVDQDVERGEVLARFPGTKMLPVILVDGVQVTEVGQFQLLLG